jgi:hypothetical protein
MSKKGNFQLTKWSLILNDAAWPGWLDRSDGLIGTMSPGGWDGGRLYRMAGIA